MAIIINGERIDQDEISEEFEAVKDHYERLGEVVCCDRDEEFWDTARDNVINRTLILQESGKKYDPITDEAVNAHFEELKAQYPDEDTFFDSMEITRSMIPHVLKKLKVSMTIDRYVDQELGSELAVDDAGLADFYQRHQAQFMTPEEVRVSQIFIEPSSQSAAKEAYQALREVREELLDGKDFTQAASEHGSQTDQDIDLGFMKQGETMPEIEAVTFSMRIGEISPIIATHFGFHLFTLTDRKESTPIPMEAIESLREMAEMERRDQVLGGHLETLKASSTIEEAADAS